MTSGTARYGNPLSFCILIRQQLALFLYSLVPARQRSETERTHRLIPNSPYLPAGKPGAERYRLEYKSGRKHATSGNARIVEDAEVKKTSNKCRSSGCLLPMINNRTKPVKKKRYTISVRPREGSIYLGYVIGDLYSPHHQAVIFWISKFQDHLPVLSLKAFNIFPLLFLDIIFSYLRI